MGLLEWNKCQGIHLSLYFQLMKGHLDERLFWSFIRTIEIALLYPENKVKHKENFTLTVMENLILTQITRLGIMNLLTMTVFTQRVSLTLIWVRGALVGFSLITQKQ